MTSPNRSAMRAIVVTRPGGPEVLAIQPRPLPEPGPGEVRVRVRAFGINRADLLQRRGHYPAPPGAPPDIPGLEFAGEIDALGAGVGEVHPGQPVMGITGGGAYAEYLRTPAEHLLAIPAGMSFTAAAAIPEAFITAFDGLERIAVVAGEWVLVHAAGSGVGTAAVQLIRARGAHALGTSRTATKLERLKEWGLEAGIDTSVESALAPSVRRFTEAGAPAAMDLVGGNLFAQTLEAMAPRGRIVLIGLTAGSRVEVDLGLILRKRLRIEGTVLRSRSLEEKTAVTRRFGDAVLPLFDTREVQPIVDRVFGFDDVAEAHAYVESNESFGKVVVTLG